MTVTLRKLEEFDLSWIAELYSHSHVMKGLLWDDRTPSTSEIRDRLTAAEAGCWTDAFAILSDLEPVGTVTLSDIHPIHRRGTITNLAAFKGHMVGLAAGELVLDYAFNTLGLNRVDCRVWESNSVTPLLCRRIGASRDGIIRQAVYRDGRFIDLAVWSLLREEYGIRTTANGQPA